MTLDFSPPPVFAAPKMSEGDFVHSIWDWEWEGLVGGRQPPCPNWGEVSAASCGGGYRRDAYGGGRGCGGGGGDWSNEAATHESVYKDILDRLPSDPFGMELGSTWTVAIAGWLEDLRAECHQADYYSKKEMADAECGLFAGINFLCNNAAWLSFDSREPQGKSGYCYDKLVPVTQGRPCEMGGLSSAPEVNVTDDMLCSAWIENPVSANGQEDCRKQNASQCIGIVSVSNTLHYTDSCTGHSSSFEDIPYDDVLVSISNTVRDIQIVSSTGNSNDHDEGTSYIEEGQPPHDGLFYALRYLEVQDLLSVERVCKTLQSAVQNDPLLWRCIHISQPLNERLTDDALFQLSQRAGGNLQCLSLVQCLRITNDGLTRILESNPHLSKLSVPGCRLSIEVLVDSLKVFNAPGMPGIKQLRIGGLYGVTAAHYDELKQILGMDSRQHPKTRKPQFYGAGSLSLPSCDSDDELDIELCPICQNLRVVYDCPSESCKGKSSEPCRGCNICITRCVHCGRCLNDSEYEETFYLDCYCLDCVNQLVQSEEAPAEGEGDVDLLDGRGGGRSGKAWC